MAVRDFKAFLETNNLDLEIIETDDATKTAAEAAEVHGVPVSNIVKSLLVKVDRSFKLFLTPGDRLLDLEKIKNDFKADEVRMANADEVKELTGYSIGGVPPFGHKQGIETHVVEGFDKDIELVAAAGSGNSVFKINFKKLVQSLPSF
jgi:prolyl-tRNA editing enzyme YbaK/EbsC (Cys-tRNA(Pro) deacylase)